MYILILYYY